MRILQIVNMVYYVYVLHNIEVGMLYVGYTTDLKRRLQEHIHGKSTFTRQNRGVGAWKLVYFEGYVNKNDAVGREKFLKGGSGRKYLNKQLRHYFLKKNLPA